MTYTLKKLLLVDFLPVLFLFSLPFYAQAGIITKITHFFGVEAATVEMVQNNNAQVVPLLRASVNANPISSGGGDVIVEDGVLVPESGPFGATDGTSVSLSNGEISVYVVREGDTLSQIASMFDVTTNTILWANNIVKASSVQPGDTLVILPITGVRHVVKKGDTVKSIASKYKGDVEEVLAYNQLELNTALSVGDTVVVPGGEVSAPVIKSTTPKVGSIAKSGGSLSGYFAHPVSGAIKTQGIHGYNGVDFGAPSGTSVRAAAAGTVVISRGDGWNGGYGQYVVIKHSNGTQTLYAHMSANNVTTGASVSQGQVIGAVGSTGRSTGNHLHFEVRGAKNPF